MSSTVHVVAPPAASPAAEPPAPAPPTRRGRRFALHRLPLAVLLCGLLLTGVSTGLSRVNYVHNEQRLTALQARITAAALSLAQVDTQRRLGRSVSLVSATGDTDLFRRTIASSLPPGPFVSVLLFKLTGTTPKLVSSLGAATLIGTHSQQVDTLAVDALKTSTLQVTRLLAPGKQRLAYAFAATGDAGSYVAYAEQVLPADRRAPQPKNSPLADLHFALYLGRTQDDSALVETDSDHVPLGGTRASTTFTFGDATFTLAVTPRDSLAGGFARWVAWLIAIVGVIFTIGMALLAERLVRRRATAERLAIENRRLYDAQRGVAETLQHSLLPRRLPEHPGLELAVRYLPGTEGIDVGGDWYDVVDVDDGGIFFTVGDVSGRGLEAAILMATLRNAINAYVMDGHGPAAVLAKVNRLVDVSRDGRFATVICGHFDLGSGRVTLANAGHPNPMLVDESGCRSVDASIGAPIGVGTDYATTELRIAPGTTLLAYTDGLVERRGEEFDAGQARLCRAARSGPSLDRMLDDVLAEMVPTGPSDDIAVLGIRWQG